MEAAFGDVALLLRAARGHIQPDHTDHGLGQFNAGGQTSVRQEFHPGLGDHVQDTGAAGQQHPVPVQARVGHVNGIAEFAQQLGQQPPGLAGSDLGEHQDVVRLSGSQPPGLL
ncbi:MAG: hypothetical protein ACRDQZ_17035, partial [Mycobacteriales bacterium]